MYKMLFSQLCGNISLGLFILALLAKESNKWYYLACAALVFLVSIYVAYKAWRQEFVKSEKKYNNEQSGKAAT